jgi:hypothetical protein
MVMGKFPDFSVLIGNRKTGNDVILRKHYRKLMNPEK